MLLAASDEIQSHVEERLFWFEKTMEVMVMYFEATELLGSRLLRCNYPNRRIFNEIISPTLTWLSSYCQQIDLHTIVEAINAGEPISLKSEEIYGIKRVVHDQIADYLSTNPNDQDRDGAMVRNVSQIFGVLANRDYEKLKQRIAVDIQGLADKVHKVLITECENDCRRELA
jgi:hypothetical protein